MSDEYLRRVRAWLRSADPAPLSSWFSDSAVETSEHENQLDLDLPWPRPSVENLRG